MLASILASSGQEFQQVTNYPKAGTFFLVSWTLWGNSVPWPYDPWPEFPVYEEVGQPEVYYIDDVGGDALARLAQQQQLAATGHMMMMEASDLPPPPLPSGGTNDSGGSADWSNPAGLDWTSNPGLYLYPPLVQGSTVSLTWTNTAGGPTTIYDVLTTTNLRSDVPGWNGTNWYWLGRTTNGQKIFYTEFLQADTCFFQLGYVTNDPCGDGIGTAYKLLVAHVDPNQCLVLLSSDGYGTPDAWYLAHGLNPLTPGIGGWDANGNGILNYQEYLRGGDPQTPAAMAVWVATPSGFSGIP
jgi:hypothetical protein